MKINGAVLAALAGGLLLVFAALALLRDFESRRESRTAPTESRGAIAFVGSNYTFTHAPEPVVDPPAIESKSGPENRRIPAGQQEPDVIENEHILSFASESDLAAFLEAARTGGAEILDILDFGNTVRLRVSGPAQLADILSGAPEPANSSGNYYVLSPDPQSDDRKAPQGAYMAFGDGSLAWLGVPDGNDSWGEGVLVAILDTGISDHPSIPMDRVTRIKLTSDGDYYNAGELSLHGTAVASLIAGTGVGVAGIAPGVDLLSIKVLSDEGVGDAFTLAKGVVEAVDGGADVVNMCLGTYGDSYLLRDAVRYAYERGVVVIAAAGNDAIEGVAYPAGYEEVIAVAAADAAGNHMYFSNRGDEIDIAAPGAGVNAAWTEDGVGWFTGTSAAAPFVAGMAAALRGEDRDLTPDQIKEILLAGANDAGRPGKDSELGAGIMDVDRIRNRNVEGIYDARVGGPFIELGKAGEAVGMIVYAQNSGTENIESMVLEALVEDVPYMQTFTDVPPGQSVGFELEIEGMGSGDMTAKPVTITVTIKNQQDADLTDNGKRTIVYAIRNP